jgi:hypothetical protein
MKSSSNLQTKVYKLQQCCHKRSIYSLKFLPILTNCDDDKMIYCLVTGSSDDFINIWAIVWSKSLGLMTFFPIQCLRTMSNDTILTFNTIIANEKHEKEEDIYELHKQRLEGIDLLDVDLRSDISAKSDSSRGSVKSTGSHRSTSSKKSTSSHKSTSTRKTTVSSLKSSSKNQLNLSNLKKLLKSDVKPKELFTLKDTIFLAAGTSLGLIYVWYCSRKDLNILLNYSVENYDAGK